MAGPKRLPVAPSLFAPSEEWVTWHRALHRLLPHWHADMDFVNSIALDLLPVVVARMGCGEPVAIIPRPRWWRGPLLPDRMLALHGTRMSGRRVVVAHRLEPGSDDLLFVDRSTGAWDCPNLCRFGHDLVSLAAWRWRITPTKAAWRVARICGLRRPVQ